MNQTTNPYFMGERPLTDFHTYYRKKIRPYLLDLERKRQQFLYSSKINERKYLALAGVVGALLATITYTLELVGSLSWAFAVLLLMVPPLVMKYWLAPVIRAQESHNDKHEAFYNRYKSKVVEAIVRFFDPSLRLQYEEQISKETVRKSQLIQDLSQVDLTGDDFVSGTINKLAISFSELQLKHIQDKPDQDIFHGIFFSAILNHSYEGAIFILPKNVLSTAELPEDISPLYQQKPLKPHHRAHNICNTEKVRYNLQPWKASKIDLPIQEVEVSHEKASNHYAVFSTNPSQAQQIVSKEFWNILYPSHENSVENNFRGWNSQDEFMRAVSRGYYISLIGNSLYLMQPQGGELFEPEMDQTFLDEEGFLTYHDHLQQAFDLMGAIHQEVGVISSYS